jgi:hypothetical protein
MPTQSVLALLSQVGGVTLFVPLAATNLSANPNAVVGLGVVVRWASSVNDCVVCRLRVFAASVPTIEITVAFAADVEKIPEVKVALLLAPECRVPVATNAAAGPNPPGRS